jgi:putative transposase
MAKYAFIDVTDTASPGYFGIKRMCGWLGVSPSGFFDWRSRPASARATRRTELAALVAWSFERSNGTYGYRRVHADLARRGVPVGLDLVRDLMRENDLLACQPRPFRVTTVPGTSDLPDLLQRDFTAEAPGRKLVGDITYIHTWDGFAYLATVIDCYSKTVIGWAVADHMRTELVIDALDMAGRNHELENDCIFHSDRGTQYTSRELGEYLAQHRMRSSMGKTGISLLTGQSWCLCWSATRHCSGVAVPGRVAGVTCVAHECQGRTAGPGTRRGMDARRRGGCAVRAGQRVPGPSAGPELLTLDGSGLRL